MRSVPVVGADAESDGQPNLSATGDEVLYHEPCYVAYAPIVTFAHGTAVPVRTSAQNGFRLTREQVEPHVIGMNRLVGTYVRD